MQIIQSLKQRVNFRKLKKAGIIILLIFLMAVCYGFGFNVGVNDRIGNLAFRGEQGEVEYGEVKNKDEIPKFLTDDVNFDLLWDVWETINRKYVEAPVPETQLFYGALMGSVAALGDPYSMFLEPETSEEFQEELQGRFEGVGAEIAIKKERLTIVAPLPDSPAEKAGIKPGDKVYEIEGEDTAGITLDEAVDKIRGPKGTPVTLGIMRGEDGEIINIEIIRDEIRYKSVQWEIKPDNIGYIKISRFNEDTSRVFDEAADDILTHDPKGIILDLRNNVGGYLDKAIDVASYWVEDEVIVIEQFGKNYEEIALPVDKKRVYYSSLAAKFKGIPTVVLINMGSASGSEIVAGALQDYGLATLVGEQTFGKGSVQELGDLSNGAGIKITVAKWLTPKGREIEGEGIAPDIEVELTEEDYNEDSDPQLDKALELLIAD